MVLQYVAASFHLPSVSTANINTVEFPKPYQQYATPRIPAVLISKVLLPQSNVNAELVSHSKFLSDSSTGLSKYNNLHTIQFTVAFNMDISFTPARRPAQYVQISKYITFYSVNIY
jgi:hypothetical protein